MDSKKITASAHDTIQALIDENEELKRKIELLKDNSALLDIKLFESHEIPTSDVQYSKPPSDIPELSGSAYNRLEFLDLFDLAEIQAIQDAFADACNVAAIITDPMGKPITTASNFTHLCTNIIRSTPAGLANCMRSDAFIGSNSVNAACTMPCLSGGLMDGGAGIYVGDKHLANWLIGQVLEEPVDEEKMLAYALEIGADREEFRKALADVPRMSSVQFSAVSRALYLIARQISQLAVRNLQQAIDIQEKQKSEDTLRDSARHFRSLFDNAPAAYQSLSADGCLLEVNDAWLNLMGYSPEEVMGKSFGDLLVPEQKVLFKQRFPVFKQIGSVNRVDFTMLSKQGKEIYVSIDGRISYNENREFIKTHCMLYDVTEQKKNEEELKLRASRQEVLVELGRRALDDITLDSLLIEALESVAHVENLELICIGQLCGDELHILQRCGLEKIQPGMAIDRKTDPLLDELLRIKEAVYANDIRTDPRFSDKAGLASERWISAAKVLIDCQDYLFGAICVFSTSPHTFSLDEISFLQAVANTLASAVKRRRVEEMLRIRGERQASVARLGEFALSEMNLESLVKEVSRTIRQMLNATYAIVFDLNGDILSVCPGSDLPEGIYPGYNFPLSESGIATYAMETDSPVVIDDWIHDRRFTFAMLKKHHNVQSCILTQFRGKSGSVGFLCVYSDHAHAFKDEDVPFVQSISNVLTAAIERKISDAALRVEEKRFRVAVINSPHPIMIYAEDGEILHISSTWLALTGYSAMELSNINDWLELAHGDRKEEVAVTIKKHFTKTEPEYVGEYRIRTKSKDYRIWDISATPIGQLPDGRHVVSSMAVDITERRRLEEQLLQTQKMEGIGRLAGGVAHDFNNLLTAILGFAELAEERVQNDPTAAVYLQNIARSAERAGNLTHQLLAFARKEIIEPKVININDRVMEVNRMLRRLIGEDIELVTLLEPDLWSIRADPGQIEQILVNMAVNARDAMPNGGRLVIETRNETIDEKTNHGHHTVLPGDYVQISITDNGLGMSKEVLAHLFEPFFTTKENGRGTGLGLATCYGIIHQSKGHIFVYSEQGHGTTMRIYLPRCVEQYEMRSNVVGVPLPGGSEVILLAEDEALVRGMALHSLRALGYEVLVASNGSEAIAVASKYAGRIDLLMTDVVMPVMGGKELAQRLSLLRPEMRILYASGYTDNTILSEDVQKAGISFMQKPYTLSMLARKVREMLDVAVS